MEECIRKLLHGFHNFQETYFSGNSELFAQLHHGQHPRVLVIACSDSRVDPALLTSCDPGDIFVIRNVANLVPPYEPGTGHFHGVSAALEYAVRVLKVEHIIILGHSDCGGVRTLLDPGMDFSGSEFLKTWLSLLEPVRKKVETYLPDAPHSTRCRACEEMSLVQGLKNLLTFPWVREAVESRQLFLHGWYFHLTRGVLYSYNRSTREFQVLTGHDQDYNHSWEVAK